MHLLHTRRSISICSLALTMLACTAASAALTPVDHEDETTLEASASLAFYEYLQAIDAGELADAYDMVLDPGHTQGQAQVLKRLVTFMNARRKYPAHNEGLIIRTSGDWALVVYQYDTTVGDKTARVIATAWMLQREGFWRQFVVAPATEDFWDTYQSDYERLQKWFDDHAEDLAPA